jgi:hypothetical protein
MKPLLTFVFAMLFATSPALAQETQASEDASAWDSISTSQSESLGDFLWISRPVIVFADSENDPRFKQQMALLEENAAALAERDVIVLTDTNPDAGGALRKALRPRGFMLALVGKDGGVKLRKASPWDVRELSRVIDKMPMREREVRERRLP